MAVNAVGGQIVVRAGEAVIAEHREAARPGQCVVAREHIEALWAVTAERIKPPAPRSLAADPAVARVDLRSFEEVAR